MSWPTVIWSMVAAACLTMALPHLLIGIRQGGARVHLFFALAAFAVAGMAAAELSIMRATTAEEAGRAMEIAHVTVAVVVIAIVGFVQLYFGTGRLWLGVVACSLRAGCVVINLFDRLNLPFREITGLRRFQFLGETVAMPLGTPSPYLVFTYLSSLLFLAFVIEASWKLWRKGTSEGRRRAVVIGGSIAIFILLAQGASVLINAGVISFPFFVSIPFMAIVAALGFELSYDVVRAAQLSRALRESEERMSLAAESARLSLWEWDISRDEVWMTEEGRTLLGFKPDTRIDFAALDARVHPEDRASRETAIRRALETGGSYETEYRLMLSDGSVQWIAARGRCAKGDDGSRTRLLGVSMDVTQQRHVDAETRKQREELAHLGRVALMGEMAASLAHELNQPLAAVVNNASAGRRFIAKGRADFPKLDELFAAVAEDGQRAGEIIRGIRNMVKKGEAVRESLALGKVIDDTIRLIVADASARDCLLSPEVAKDLPPVEGDAVQLQQVLLNLIINACEAMRDTPPERRRVLICAEREGGGRVRVSVRDFGAGLPTENPQRIFEQFFSTKREGMGMGLAIARGIISSHGGELAGGNAEDGGALLHFSLPASGGNGA